MTLWVNTPFDTLPGEGGRPMRYWLLCRALVAAGHEVVLWSSDFHHVTKKRRELESTYMADGFQVRLIPTRPYRANVGVQRAFSHWQYARRWAILAREGVASGNMRRPDCILVSLPPLDSFGAAARMRAAWGSRVVVDVQDAWPETFYRLLPAVGRRWGPLLFWPARRLARRAYRDADGVTAVAARYLQLVREAGCQAPTAHFPLACPLPPISMDSKPVGAQPLRLCYVGNLGSRYDIQTLIDGMRQLAAEGLAVTLAVAGDGPQRAQILEAIRGGAPITYGGYLKQEALLAFMKSCDVGVVPMFATSWVAVPNKVVDYAATGLAMINGLKGEAQDLLDHYGAGVAYEAGDVRSFITAVRRYAHDPALRSRHAQGARRMAETEFDAALQYPQMASWLVALTQQGQN